MTNLRLCLMILFATLLTACATSKTPLTVLQINSLDATERNTGSFKGLEFLADPIPGDVKNRVNILYLHGIGYTEDSTADQLAGEFLGGIANAYDLDETDGLVTTLCGAQVNSEMDRAKPHIYVRADTPRIYETVIPGSQLKLNDLVCMDKQVLDIDETLEFVVYRIFWDNIFWDSLQFPHVGQDDDRGSSQEIAQQRRKYNRILKDDLVNYGFSDAVMYLGTAGVEIRNAVKGAMCSAALDASGYSFEKQGDDKKRLAAGRACDRATNTQLEMNQFAFVTESLGSKIMFDVMRSAMTDGQTTIHDDMIRNSETYMLANQLALLSLSDISTTPTKAANFYSESERPRIIAMSEINDFLSYELIPFYEQLYKRSLRQDVAYNTNLTLARRRRLIEEIGFNVVDMRLEFADKIIPFVDSFVHPKDAHSGHAGEAELMKYILCGAQNGQRREGECLVLDDVDTGIPFLSDLFAPIEEK